MQWGFSWRRFLFCSRKMKRTRNIKLVIEYDGTGYHGWQCQKNALSVQSVLEKALEKLTGEDVKLIGAGRTDAGVHALGQVANFHTASAIPAERFTAALNSLLPPDISILESSEVPAGFHARYSAIGKRYRYLLYYSQQPSALLRHRAFHVRRPLDLEAMQAATAHFLGTHNFKAFCAAGSGVKSCVRTIKDISLREIYLNSNENGIEMFRNGKLYLFEIAGSGFLYNMVRIIVGTLVEVGTGRILPSEIPDIIQSEERKHAGRTAPPHGLYLAEVIYGCTP